MEIDRDRADRDIAPLYEHLAAAIADLLSGYADDEIALIRDYLQGGYELMRDETNRLRET